MRVPSARQKVVSTVLSRAAAQGGSEAHRKEFHKDHLWTGVWHRSALRIERSSCDRQGFPEETRIQPEGTQRAIRIMRAAMASLVRTDRYEDER